jgi:hypothetical protein
MLSNANARRLVCELSVKDHGLHRYVIPRVEKRPSKSRIPASSDTFRREDALTQVWPRTAEGPEVEVAGFIVTKLDPALLESWYGIRPVNA